MDFFEQEYGKKTIPLSELIIESKSYLDDNIAYYKQAYGDRLSDKFSKESIRSVIYLTIPLYFNVIQYNRAKIISLTPKGKDFISWIEQESFSKKRQINIENGYWWLSKAKINFVEEHIPVKNNNIDYGLKNKVENTLKTTSPIITNKAVIKNKLQQ